MESCYIVFNISLLYQILNCKAVNRDRIKLQRLCHDPALNLPVNISPIRPVLMCEHFCLFSYFSTAIGHLAVCLYVYLFVCLFVDTSPWTSHIRTFSWETGTHGWALNYRLQLMGHRRDNKCLATRVSAGTNVSLWLLTQSSQLSPNTHSK